MGSVYLAEDPMLKRRLAIKVVRAVGEERDLALERFKREAEISAQLNHPNIVTIYDVGEEPELGPFLAMEYVEGQSLGKYIRDGTLDPETRLGILVQAMRALRAAHRHAIIHRDVKPDNILVSEDGRVKLMDFGIAKTMAPRLTSKGEFLGSPAYSAPELLRGADPTPSSDRFAYGVTAFELMTGQLPHPGSNVAAVITHVLHESIVIPPGMSGDLGNIFRKALAFDPEDRYETLIEFLTALIDVYPLDSGAKGRVEDLFSHDDRSGDIVPLRRSRPRPPQQAGQDTGSGLAQRNTAGRSTPVRPSMVTTAAIRIELEPGQSTNASYRPPVGRPGNSAPGKAEAEGISPKTLVKWILIVLVFGPLVMWLLDILRTYLPQG